MAQRHRRLVEILPLILTLLPEVLSESFRDSPPSITVLTHSPLTLTCYAPDPSPPPSLLWLINGVAFQPNDDRRTAQYDPTTGRSIFQFSDVLYSDAGEYKCQAINEMGSFLFESDTGTLSVQGQPSFRQPLRSITAAVGSQAVFQCLVVSNPPATVSWTHGQQNLSNGGRIFLNSSALVISGVQSSDEGYYYCNAQNLFGVNSTSASLTIGEPLSLDLSISPSGDPLQLARGSDVTLYCEVGGAGSVDSLHWFHNGVEVVEHLTRESNGLALSLEDLTMEDGGVYRCVATSGTSSVTQSIQLEILIPPTVELSPSITTILVVDHTLADPLPQCTARGTPQPTISWLSPNGQVLEVSEGAPVLRTHLTRSESGVYECVATNSAGENRTQLTLVVEDSPLITVPPMDTVVAYGGDVSLTCSAEGPPTPAISWSRGDGVPLGNTSLEISGTLHLFSVSVEDSGVYVCETSNGYDPADRASATLTILGPPMVISLTVDPSPILISGTTFTITCSFPASPAPFSIHWYQNGTLISTGDSRFQMVTGEGSGTLTVYGPDQSYSALYTCNVTTGYGFDTAQVTVTLGSVPVIDKTSSDTDLAPGGGTFLDCTVTGLPNPRIDWFMMDETGIKQQFVTTVGEHYVIHTERLELVDATQQESGVYECHTTNELGTDMKTARVRVEGVPLARDVSPTVLIAGNNHTLTCDVIYNFPTATITWRRADSTLLSPERFTATPTGVLNISPVAPNDGGVYECVASNEYGVTVASAEVTVHVRPTVSLPSPSVVAILFDAVTLSCSVEGNPVPSQEWTRNGGLPLLGSRYVIDTNTGDVTIDTVRATDMANYSCTATNIVGVATAVLEVLVRGAPITNLTAVVLNSTAISLSWSHPPPELTLTLSSYLLQYGVSSSQQRQTAVLDISVNSVLLTELEEASLYQFSVFGDYGDVFGVVVTVTATTDEDVPTAAPQNVLLDGVVEALKISWLAPPEAERNGIIIRYDIFYREMGETNSTSSAPLSVFSVAEYTPSDPQASDHSTRLGGLAGGKKYQVKLRAATSVGVGPNSTLVSTETLEPFPLLLVLAIGIPAATILLLLCLLVSLCLCYRCCYLRSRAGKHSPLTEEANLSGQRQHRKGRVISGPVPGIAPNIETTGGKFVMTTKQGQVFSSQPKVIMPEDVATPPPAGCVVKQVSMDDVLTSVNNKHDDDPYEEVGIGYPPDPHPSIPDPPNMKSNPLYNPDEQDGPQVWVNPHYNRLNQSDDPTAPIGNLADPNDYGPQPDSVQGGSLPDVAHTGGPPSEEDTAYLGEKSQSLDMNVNMWPGLPQTEKVPSEAAGEGDREEDKMEEGVRDEVEERGMEGGYGEEGYVEVEEEEEEVQGQGDGWEQHLIRQEAHEGEGGMWGERSMTREAEEEVEEEEEEEEMEGEGLGRYTDEGREERYVGEEEEAAPEITPAPLDQTADELGASQNSLNLAPETEDDTQQLYATIPESHKATKRLKMMKQAQKEERKARKKKLKMEEKEEKARRRAREKERKEHEKQRKKGIVELQDMGEVMKLHGLDTKTSAGRAQAQFIDAATASFF